MSLANDAALIPLDIRPDALQTVLHAINELDLRRFENVF